MATPKNLSINPWEAQDPQMAVATKSKAEESSPARKRSVANGARVLIVEDEQDLLELLGYHLSREGFKVSYAERGEEALASIRSNPPDLVLLDLMLPGMNGLEVCRSVKANPDLASIPVVMVTAKGEEPDIVVGLELGADDYITKPFSPRVLLARVNAVMRRSRVAGGEQASGDGSAISVRGLTIDQNHHQVTIDGQPVTLTATEFKLLVLLASKPGRVFTRQQIIHTIHDGLCAVTDRSVDVQVVSLRRKLGDMGSDIETVRGVGYRFRD